MSLSFLSPDYPTDRKPLAAPMVALEAPRLSGLTLNPEDTYPAPASQTRLEGHKHTSMQLLVDLEATGTGTLEILHRTGPGRIWARAGVLRVTPLWRSSEPENPKQRALFAYHGGEVCCKWVPDCYTQGFAHVTLTPFHI